MTPIVKRGPTRSRSLSLTVVVATLAMLLLTPAPAAALQGLPPVTSPPGGQPAAPDPRPNIVMIMVDDLPPLDGRLYAALPQIRDAFINKGVQFSNFRSETPLCCPARVGFLTGQYTWHHGVNQNAAWLFHPEMSLATQLKGSGYQTMMVGKYLNGYSRLAPAVPPGWDIFNAKDGEDYYNYTFWNNGSPKPEKHGRTPTDYLTDVIRQKALDALSAADPSKPIFAWFATNAPHKPWTAAPRFANDRRCNSIAPWKPPNYAEKNISGKPAFVQSSPRYRPSELRLPTGFDLKPVCLSMLAVDELVGRVKSVLAQQGRLDNTIFVFSGDNGMNLGAHRLDSKLGPYETGIPFFISWPKQLGAGARSVDDIVMNIDFAPTICELAGCTLGPYPNGQQTPDGRSFAALLKGSASSLKRDSVVEDLPLAQQGVPEWYGVRSTGASNLVDAGCEQAAVNGCRWHYIHYANGFEELYDVSGGPCITWVPRWVGDPCELTNVASDPMYLPVLNAMRYRLNVLAGNPPGSR